MDTTRDRGVTAAPGRSKLHLAFCVFYIALTIAAMYVLWGVLLPLYAKEVAPTIADWHLRTFYSEDYLGRSC